jgi:hypothetical protein
VQLAGSRAGASHTSIDSSNSISSSSSISKAAVAHEPHTIAAVLALAGTIQRACRPRVQLVGCGNPRCANLSGASAEGLVAGCKGVRCGGCQVARYCSLACQQVDWPWHRHVCRRLAGAAAAAAAELGRSGGSA